MANEMVLERPELAINRIREYHWQTMDHMVREAHEQALQFHELRERMMLVRPTTVYPPVGNEVNSAFPFESTVAAPRPVEPTKAAVLASPDTVSAPGSAQKFVIERWDEPKFRG
jgi:hypothetical protein